MARACRSHHPRYDTFVQERRRFERWAQALLALTLLVILWGAYVRVTGSGAGCADHWPLCNGELIPRSPRLETVIELTHRVTSGLAGLLALAVTVLAWRRYPAGSPVRFWAGLALSLMLVEGAVGALLVKQGLVADDASSWRALVVGLHLCNTFLLLGAQLMTLRVCRSERTLCLKGRGARAAQVGALLLLVLLLGASGAVTALGDTLFPAGSLAEGLRQDLAPGAHFLVRLRVWHPLLAFAVGGVVVFWGQQLRARTGDSAVGFWAGALMLVYLAQLAAGSLNLMLLAPSGLQILHLLLADLTWLVAVELGFAALSERPAFASVQVP